MIEKNITIINKLGLHARAAAKFVTLASSFTASIDVTKGSKTVDGKSIMGIMLLAAGQGSELTLRIDGPDEQQALSALEMLISQRFDEAE